MATKRTRARSDAPPVHLVTESRPLELRERLERGIARLGEAGRVLSAANEDRIRAAVDSLNEVLSTIDAATGDTGTETDAETTEAKRRVAEAWSGSAWDASTGAYLLAALIDLMGEESDETDQFAMLKTAFDAINQWITAEVAEINTPDDDTADELLVDWEAARPKNIREAVVGDPLPLREAAVDAMGGARIKVIQPGWGSSGYYPAAVLERDGAKAFPAGTKMFWDHPTVTEDLERPERSLRDFAAETTTAAVWEANGAQGPGLYADAIVFDDYRGAVNELAPYIGVSIRALGRAHTDTIEGRTGPVIDSLLVGESIDFVTTPGAGGQVLQLFEAARHGRPKTPTKEDVTVDPKEFETKLGEAHREKDAAITEAARLRERLVLSEATRIAGAKLAGADVPELTRKRLAEAVVKNPPVTATGELDTAAFETAIDEAVKAEAAYLAAVSGSGSVSGFGGSRTTGGETDVTEAEQRVSEAMKGLGLSDSAAAIAARGRR